MKGLLNVLLVVLMGALSIIEIGIEVVYQITRLVRRGYGNAMNWFLRKIKTIYTGKIQLNIRPEKETDKDIKIYEFHYE